MFRQFLIREIRSMVDDGIVPPQDHPLGGDHFRKPKTISITKERMGKEMVEMSVRLAKVYKTSELTMLYYVNRAIISETERQKRINLPYYRAKFIRAAKIVIDKRVKRYIRFVLGGNERYGRSIAGCYFHQELLDNKEISVINLLCSLTRGFSYNSAWRSDMEHDVNHGIKPDWEFLKAI